MNNKYLIVPKIILEAETKFIISFHMVKRAPSDTPFQSLLNGARTVALVNVPKMFV